MSDPYQLALHPFGPCPTPLRSSYALRRLLDLIAEDHALDDTLYHLGRALNSSNSSSIDMDKFFKVSGPTFGPQLLDSDPHSQRVRMVGREQFMARSQATQILNLLATNRRA